MVLLILAPTHRGSPTSDDQRFYYLLPHHFLTRKILVEYSDSMIVHLLRVNINLGASVTILSHHLKQISKGGLSF